MSCQYKKIMKMYDVNKFKKKILLVELNSFIYIKVLWQQLMLQTKTLIKKL